MEGRDTDAQPPITIGGPPSGSGANGISPGLPPVGDDAAVVPSAPSPSGPIAMIQRDALIFLPGMARTWDAVELRDIAADVATAMNRLSRGLDFEVAPDSIGISTDRPRGGGLSTVTITRAVDGAAGATPMPVLDLYTLEYQSGLVEPRERQPVIVRAILVLVAIIFGLHRISRLLNPLEHSKSWIERAQILYLLGILLLYAVFLAVLFISIFQFTREALISVQRGANDVSSSAAAVTPTVPASAPTPAASPSTDTTASDGMLDAARVYVEPAWAPVGAFVDSLFVRVVHLVTLIGALVWLLLPPRSKVKEFVTNTATDYLAIDYYLRSGTGAGRVQGELVGLVDAIRDDPRYAERRIYLVAYSFGSVLAINALFPSGEAPLPGSPMTSIHTLVTIGCPFDVVRMSRPGYFKDRHGPADTLTGGWLNVYTPNDILGSTFRGISDISSGDASEPAAAQPADDGSAADGDDHSWDRVTGGGMPKPTSRMYVPGSAPQEMNALSLLALNGFRAHQRYWDPGHNRDDSCFTTIVDYLYRDDPVLRR